jgi:hypothetical protein
MAPFKSCDHCGRTGVTFGVYYPNRDMSQPPVYLCQTQHGVPIEPACYHLVRERGEALGLRKSQAILASDRHSPRVEATQIRFNQSPGGAIYTETERPEPEPADPTAQPVLDEHPLSGQSIPSTPPEPLDEALTTTAEQNQGLTNPHSADQTPLIQPDSPEGQVIADAAAAAEAAKVVLPGGLGSVGDRDVNPRTGGVPGRYPSGPVGDPRTGTEREADAQAAQSRVDAGLPAEDGDDATLTPTELTPAQVAAAAQAQADAEAAKPPAKKAPAKKAPAKTAPKTAE